MFQRAMKPSICMMAVYLSSALLSPTLAQSDDTPAIEPGMVLEVYAIGVPDFRYQVSVSTEGEASFPLLDPATVTGMTLRELREIVRTELSTRVYRQRSEDGTESLMTFLPEEIGVEIAEYPPVFVTGDVTSPGEIRFRPNLNVREAIALAGGVNTVRSLPRNPAAEAVDLRGEYMSTLIEHASIQAERIGIEAMLFDRPLEGLKGRLEAPLSDTVLEDISRAETMRVELLEGELRRERAHILDLVESAKAELQELLAEQDFVRTRLTEQEEVTEQFRDGLQRGVISVSRYAEEQRHQAYMQERLFATSTRIAALRREIETLQRRHEVVAAQHRSDLLSGLRETGVRLSTLQARVETLEDRMTQVGVSRASGLDGRRPTIVLHRRGTASGETTVGDEDTILLSGDVVEVMVEWPSWGRLERGF